MIDLNKIAEEQSMVLEITLKYLEYAKRVQSNWRDNFGLPDNHILIGEIALGVIITSAIMAGIELQKGNDREQTN